MYVCVYRKSQKSLRLRLLLLKWLLNSANSLQSLFFSFFIKQQSVTLPHFPRKLCAAHLCVVTMKITAPGSQLITECSLLIPTNLSGSFVKLLCVQSHQNTYLKIVIHIHLYFIISAHSLNAVTDFCVVLVAPSKNGHVDQSVN